MRVLQLFLVIALAKSSLGALSLKSRTNLEESITNSIQIAAFDSFERTFTTVILGSEMTRKEWQKNKAILSQVKKLYAEKFIGAILLKLRSGYSDDEIKALTFHKQQMNLLSFKLHEWKHQIAMLQARESIIFTFLKQIALDKRSIKLNPEPTETEKKLLGWESIRAKLSESNEDPEHIATTQYLSSELGIDFSSENLEHMILDRFIQGLRVKISIKESQEYAAIIESAPELWARYGTLLNIAIKEVYSIAAGSKKDYRSKSEKKAYNKAAANLRALLGESKFHNFLERANKEDYSSYLGRYNLEA